MFPTRDQMVEHLERHAADGRIDLRLGTRVGRLERDGTRWLLRTDGEEIRASQVVVATGNEREPFIPDWEGRAAFAGPLLHSSEYRNPDRFRRRRVLVVGPGCSGMEIAYDLAEGGAARVWLAVRTPPNLLLRAGVGGVPGDILGVTLLRFPVGLADAITRFGQRQDFGDLGAYGLPLPEEGVFARLHRLRVSPAIVDREVVEAIKAGRIEVVRGVEALEPSGVRLADGARVEPDAIVCATGFRPGLEPHVGHLGVLDPRGVPRALGERPAAPGLRFAGYVVRPGGLHYMGAEGKRVARAIAVELRERQAGQPAAR